MTDFIGKIFDRKYRLTKLIGEGGMGAVYEAEHTVIQRKVALKVMHPEFSESKEIIDRFFREAQASSAIGHPNIIEIQDVGVEEDGTAFIVMELLTGMTLADKMKTGETILPGHAVAIILQVLSALVEAHKKGIIHRDLKPDNIFLSVDARGRQEVKLLDFGIAKVQGELEGDQGLTKTGTVLGTPNYMSPEQARGKKIDHRIDIWAAGVMLYELLSGRLPFSGESYNEVLSEILLEEPDPLDPHALGVPPGLVAVVDKAMAKDRNDRYRNVQAMIHELLPYKEAADSIMTDTAEDALKTSMMPPPVYEDRGDTRGPAAVGVTLRELEFGRTIPPRPRRRPSKLLVWVSLLVMTSGVLVGLAYYFKKENQTLLQSGISLAETAIGFWKGKTDEAAQPPSDPSITKVAPVERAGTEAKRDTAEKTASKEGKGRRADEVMKKAEEDVKSKDDPATKATESAVLPKEVTITFTGVPKKGAKLVLNGKKISDKVTLPRSSKPMTLRVTATKFKPLIMKITPDKNQTIEVDMTKKGRKKRNRKKR